jgi:hypothetical protein
MPIERPVCVGRIQWFYVCSGSASAGRVRELTAGKMTPKLCDRKADVRGRQYTTLCGHPHRCIERSEAAFERAN